MKYKKTTLEDIKKNDVFSQQNYDDVTFELLLEEINLLTNDLNITPSIKKYLLDRNENNIIFNDKNAATLVFMREIQLNFRNIRKGNLIHFNRSYLLKNNVINDLYDFSFNQDFKSFPDTDKAIVISIEKDIYTCALIVDKDYQVSDITIYEWQEIDLDNHYKIRPNLIIKININDITKVGKVITYQRLRYLLDELQDIYEDYKVKCDFLKSIL